MLFKNREVRIRLDKPQKAGKETATAEEKSLISPDTVKLVAERSKDVVRYAAIAAVGTYAAIKAIDTLSQIAVKKTKSADNEK